MAKKRKRRATNMDRLERLVRLQQNAVERWTNYAVSASRLLADGSVAPKKWMEEYGKLSRGTITDMSEFLRLFFSSAPR